MSLYIPSLRLCVDPMLLLVDAGPVLECGGPRISGGLSLAPRGVTMAGADWHAVGPDGLRAGAARSAAAHKHHAGRQPAPPAARGGQRQPHTHRVLLLPAHATTSVPCRGVDGGTYIILY